MNTSRPTLASFAKNIHSQFGEDGMIEEIIRRIGTQSKICIEFGAWDGFYHANTANLWTNGWSGTLIESNPERVQTLKENTKQYNCTCIEARVEISGDSSLEHILLRSNIRQAIDLLSIDIDSDDYHIFAGLTQLKPRIVICEYNPTIPPHLDIVAAPGSYFGASARAITRLAEERGYALVGITDTNCLFVQKNEAHAFADLETSFDNIAVTRHLTYLITDYAGNYMTSRKATYGFNLPSDQPLVHGELVRSSEHGKILWLCVARLKRFFRLVK